MDIRTGKRKSGILARSKNLTWEVIRQEIALNIKKDSDGCWVWTAPLNEGGYGRLRGDGAHRMSYMANVGPIGKGLDIDHLCRNRSCVNPDHLEPVTRKVNLARGVGIELQKEKARCRTHCKEGHELDEDNTYIRPSDGARICRKCRAIGWIEHAKENRDVINKRKREWRAAWRKLGIRK